MVQFLKYDYSDADFLNDTDDSVPAPTLLHSINCYPTKIAAGWRTIGTTIQCQDAGKQREYIELADLMNDIASVIPAKWRAVGIQLNLSTGELDSIQNQNAGKPESDRNSFEQVFNKWRQQCTNPDQYTWQKIVQVLKTPSVQEHALAERLNAWYAGKILVSKDGKKHNALTMNHAFNGSKCMCIILLVAIICVCILLAICIML